MCKYASFVLTKDKVFWSKTTESHSEIIREFNLCEADSTNTRINTVNVEINPGAKWEDLSTWAYKVDQDLLPEWFDDKECEDRTRKALKEKIDKKLLNNFALLDGFLAEIKTIKWLKRHRQPLKKWKVFYGMNLAAARAAAWAAAVAAARAAAWDAARAAGGLLQWMLRGLLRGCCEGCCVDAAGDAAWAAAGDAAWAAARAAAGAAARAAAGDAAGDAAWDAARDAAGDAARAAAGMLREMSDCKLRKLFAPALKSIPNTSSISMSGGKFGSADMRCCAM